MFAPSHLTWNTRGLAADTGAPRAHTEEERDAWMLGSHYKTPGLALKKSLSACNRDSSDIFRLEMSFPDDVTGHLSRAFRDGKG